MEIYGAITQLGECHNGIVEVESSNLFSSTKKHSNRKAFSLAVYYYMNEKAGYLIEFCRRMTGIQI